MEGQNKSNQILLVIIGITTLLIAILGVTFSYFTATEYKEKSCTNETPTLSVTYNHQNIISFISPFTETKNEYIAFKVNSDSQNTRKYYIGWDKVSVPEGITKIVRYADPAVTELPFVECTGVGNPTGCIDRGIDFQYSLYTTTESLYVSLDETNEKYEAAITGGIAVSETSNLILADANNNTVIKKDLSISKNKTNYYILKVTFSKDNTTSQNYQTGKGFVGSIKVQSEDYLK